MIRLSLFFLLVACAPSGLVLLLAGCGVVAPARHEAPAAAAPAAAAPHAPPRTGHPIADGVSNASPADVVDWLRPWLAGILTVAVVVCAVIGAALRSRSMASLAAACAVGLAVVMILKVVVWVLAVLLGLAVLGALLYLAREVWRHRAALAAYDPLHHLLTRKATP